MHGMEDYPAGLDNLPSSQDLAILEDGDEDGMVWIPVRLGGWIVQNCLDAVPTSYMPVSILLLSPFSRVPSPTPRPALQFSHLSVKPIRFSYYRLGVQPRPTLGKGSRATGG